MFVKSVVRLIVVPGMLVMSGNVFAQDSAVCLLSGKPAAEYKYQVVKKLKVAKGTYGSVTNIQPKFVQEVNETGADAVIRYHAGQRFGFWPWRVVRPVISGVAVKWDSANEKPFSCIENGGTFL